MEHVADIHDLGAPSRIAAVTFDSAGRPIVFGSDDGQTFTAERYDGSAWTTSDVTGTRALQFLPGPVAIAGKGDSYDVWELTDEASFAWTHYDVPSPPCSGSWRIVGIDATGRYFAVVDGGSLVMFTWHAGDKDWVQVPDTSEAGFEQGAVVTPNGVAFLSFSPPDTENFDYQRIQDGAPAALSPCAGEMTAISDNGVVDDASDLFFEVCELSALYVVPEGGTCYRKVADLPPDVCGLAGVAPDGTAFIFPTTVGDGSILRLMPGATAWDTITGEGIDGTSGFVARDATTLYRFGGNRPGLAEADL